MLTSSSRISDLIVGLVSADLKRPAASEWLHELVDERLALAIGELPPSIFRSC